MKTVWALVCIIAATAGALSAYFNRPMRKYAVIKLNRVEEDW